ncbi:MAG: 50S ribosomal protein L24 [Flavobacteriia bacterium]|jgi:large subunit ribosomal protein L24|nr:50S ribosomal protein L24 [Flavobacteriia bacterium]
MQTKLKIKVGDLVQVISGESKGQEGKIISISRTKMRATIEGVNMVKRHTKPSASNPQGEIVEKEGTIHISNLMLVVNGAPTRVGRKLDDAGKLVRFSKKSGEVIK